MAIFLWWNPDVHAPKNGAGGGPNIVPLIVLSKNTPGGSVVTGGVPGNCTPASDCTGAVPNHYSLLRTIEDMTEASPVPYSGTPATSARSTCARRSTFSATPASSTAATPSGLAGLRALRPPQAGKSISALIRLQHGQQRVIQHHAMCHLWQPAV